MLASRQFSSYWSPRQSQICKVFATGKVSTGGNILAGFGEGKQQLLVYIIRCLVFGRFLLKFKAPESPPSPFMATGRLSVYQTHLKSAVRGF